MSAEQPISRRRGYSANQAADRDDQDGIGASIRSIAARQSTGSAIQNHKGGFTSMMSR